MNTGQKPIQYYMTVYNFFLLEYVNNPNNGSYLKKSLTSSIFCIFYKLFQYLSTNLV